MSFMAKVVPNPRPFFDLQEQYKQCLMEESALNKAAKLAAEEDMPLNSNLPDGIKVAAVKPLTRQVRVWTKRVRHGGGGGGAPKLQTPIWPNRPFYSCVLGDLSCEWKWGWRWPCFDTNLSAFYMLIILFSC